MKFIPFFCCAILTASSAWGDVSKITLYLDGARVEREVAVKTGGAEIQLPNGMAAGSLRIKPLRGGELLQVDLVPDAPDRKLSRELTRLSERTDELNDRLKALDVREEIFRSAAKTQSGKTPRKTKTNREPLEELRKGTEYAIAQLEGVYRARRKTEVELKSVATRISALRNGGTGTGSVAKIRFSERNSWILVSYFNTSLRWIPSYDFRVGAGKVEIVVNARYPRIEKGASVTVVPALHTGTASVSALPLRTGEPGRVAAFRFPLIKELFTQFPDSSLVFSFRNSSGNGLPPGEASCYRNGEYLGSLTFRGSKPDETSELDCGSMSRADGQQDLQSSTGK